jgi:hypothetical protein
MKTIINDNVSVEVHNGTVFVHLKKHQSIVISADDKYRKGIEFDVCSKCKVPCLISMWAGKKKYCTDCSLEVIKGLKK